jgi:hypothetical protein
MDAELFADRLAVVTLAFELKRRGAPDNLELCKRESEEMNRRCRQISLAGSPVELTNGSTAIDSRNGGALSLLDEQ